MKNRTQYRTETTLNTIEKTCNNAPYIPCKKRGNTLVPVIIALAISALATIAFLTQGANLAMDNKVVVAQNELARIISDWDVAKAAANNDPTGIPAGFITGNNSTYNLAMAYTVAQAPATSGGAPTNATITYQTESAEACNALSIKIPSAWAVISGAPNCNNTATLTVTLQ
ncbi:MAG: hypothetical protein P8I13_06915 [Porticoccaceae bacterium]|nr:hypothetical protein [Porticoccaceae bacterium]